MLWNYIFIHCKVYTLFKNSNPLWYYFYIQISKLICCTEGCIYLNGADLFYSNFNFLEVCWKVYTYLKIQIRCDIISIFRFLNLFVGHRVVYIWIGRFILFKFQFSWSLLKSVYLFENSNPLWYYFYIQISKLICCTEGCIYLNGADLFCLNFNFLEVYWTNKIDFSL